MRRPHLRGFYGENTPEIHVFQCVPYNVPIIHGVPHGAEIRIKGESVHGCEERFVIRFIGGEHYDDEPLHFNARFGYGGDHAIVMNSKHHDQWGCGKCIPCIPSVSPVLPGQSFPERGPYFACQECLISLSGRLFLL
jgi:hypothetical protein